MQRKSLLFAVLACLWVPATHADWTAHADFTNCPRKYFPNPTAQEGPFATEAACEAKVAEAKRGNNASCARYSCKEGAAGSGSSSAAPGQPLDSTIERAIAAGVSGDISGTDAAALVGIGVLANALLAGPSPEQQRQAEAQRQLRQQQEAERARQQAAAEEERKDRLLGEMQGVEHGTELQLMTDDSTEPLPASGVAAGGELALMTDDDDTRGIMGKRNAPAPKRNQPPATRVSPGPYTTPVSAPGRAGANGQALAMNDATPEPARVGPTDRESIAQGREDGLACRQRSVGAHCGVLRGDALGSCQRSYNLGFDAGAGEHQRRLGDQGAAAGARDRLRTKANPNPSNRAVSYAEARGPCGNIFVQAYNNAFRQ